MLPAAAGLEVQTLVRLATNAPYCGLWFVAHMYDVLRGYDRAAGVISRPLPHLGGDQAELYTLHYVQSLMGNAATWQLAAAYLAWCPVHGRDAFEALVGTAPFPLADERAAHKALALCRCSLPPCTTPVHACAPACALTGAVCGGVLVRGCCT